MVEKMMDLRNMLDGIMDSINEDEVRDKLTYMLESQLIREFNKWYASGRGDSEQLEEIIKSALLLWLKYQHLNGEGEYRYRVMGLQRG